MSIEEHIKTIKDCDNNINIRFDSLQKLYLQVNSIKDILSNDKSSLFQATFESIIDSLEANPINEALVIQYCDVLYNHISKTNYLFYVSGNNWFSSSIKKYLNNNNYIVLSDIVLSQFNNLQCVINIQCTEDSHLKEYPFLATIALWKYMKYTYFSFPEYWSIKSAYDKRKNNEIQCIITGMSYFRDALKPDLLPINAVSLANSSQDLYYDYLMLKKAIRECSSNISTAIIGLAPYSLRYDESKSKQVVNRIFSYIHEFDDSHNLEITSDCFSFLSEQKNLINKYLKNEMLDYIFSNGFVPLYGDGSFDDRLVFSSNYISEASKSEITAKYNKPYLNTIKENKEILFQMLSICQNHSIRVFIFIPPYSNWYKENWDELYYKELCQYITHLRSKFEFDFIDMSLDTWPDYYFRDYAHVNRLGSIKVCEAFRNLF